jgi:glycosyltransferase involved in cell wall biosynthesis
MIRRTELSPERCVGCVPGDKEAAVSGIVSDQIFSVILVASNCSLRMGGEAAIPFHLFRLLQERNVAVDLVTHERNREEMERTFPTAVNRIHFTPDGPIQWLVWRLGERLPVRVERATLGLLRSLVDQVSQRRVVRKLVRARGAIVVHQAYPVSPVEPSLLTGVGAPVIIGPMNGNMDYPPGFRDLENPFERLAVVLGRRLRHVVNYIFPGKRHARFLLVANSRSRELLPTSTAEVIEMADNGVDLCLWRPGEIAQREGPNEGVHFVYLGRLVDWKAVDLLLWAWSAADRSPSARLHVIGDGPMLEKLVTMRDRLGLSESVEFAGFVPQAECASRLRRADALILPSLIECGGAVVLEAMATGLPVIATDWGGPADYLDESCGILVPPTSREVFIEGLARGIERLDRSPELRRELGEAARRRAEMFDWDRKIDMILEIYARAASLDESDPTDTAEEALGGLQPGSDLI